MSNRWTLENGAIVWNTTGDVHTDTIEMAGRQAAAIVTYGTAEDGTLVLHRELRYPKLRTLPKDTYATLGCHHDERQIFLLEGEPAYEYPISFAFDGVVTVTSRDRTGSLEIVRRMLPCRDDKAYLEHVTVCNISTDPLRIASAGVEQETLARGAKGVYPVRVEAAAIPEQILKPGESLHSDLVFSARFSWEKPVVINGAEELVKRREFASAIMDRSLTLKSSNPTLDGMFRFAKLRAAESIFDTAAGPLHSPGGGAYYAAVWTNDQIEYAGPFFPFLGYARANEASLNAYQLYIPFMGSNLRAIPSSIIDEGNDIWEGAGDRGDAAMYLYGLSRFLLANGNPETAKAYFNAVDWCVRYCRSQINANGVIASDSDELEERFPSGDANLCTSSLTYGGLLSAADLAKELGMPEKQEEYLSFASALRGAMERFFGATVSGYETYRYYEGNTQLRSWICIPLTMGIMERKEGTVAALLSDRLFKQDGLVCVEDNETFWDRSTLYALRGILNAGRSDEVYAFLDYYCNKRLLTEHVPYAVEAYPEGNQRHLSAESALFARIVTEGIFGITPKGFSSFAICPSVPKALGRVGLRDIRAFGNCFSIAVERTDDIYHVAVSQQDGITQEMEIPCGDTAIVELR